MRLSKIVQRVPMGLRLLVSAVALAASTLASAATLTKVVVSGDPVPGLSGTTVDSVFQSKINDAGQVYVAVSASGAEISSSNNIVGLLGSPGALGFVYQEGGQAPGFPAGAVFQPNASPTNERLANDGRATFSFDLQADAGLGITSDNNAVTWIGTPGSIAPLLREGDPAPGLSGPVLTAPNGRPTVTSTGKIAVPHTLATGPGGVTASDNAVLFYGSSPATLTPLVREGSQAPDAPAGALMNSFSEIAHGDHVFLSGTLRQGAGGVTSTDDAVNWATDSGGNLRLVLREGQEVVGLPGLIEPGTQLNSTSERAANAAGQLLAYNAELRIGPNVTSSNNRVVMFGSAESTMTVIAREGTPAPDLPGVNWGNSFGEGRLADDGTIVLQNQLMQGGSVTSANDSALFIGTPGDLHLLVREGSQAPGFAPGVNFTSWNSSSFDVNDIGTFAILVGVEDGLGFFSLGLFATDPSTGALDLVVQRGDMLEVGPGLFKEIGNMSLSLSETQQGINDLNQIAFNVTFTDGTEGLFLAQVPEPGSFALAGLAMAGLMIVARRRGSGRRNRRSALA